MKGMDELERIRRAVERGDTLAESDLARLRAALSHDPGLRLVLAHALINADRERDALEGLVALVRDFPRNHSVRLAYARALPGSGS